MTIKKDQICSTYHIVLRRVVILAAIISSHHIVLGGTLNVWIDTLVLLLMLLLHVRWMLLIHIELVEVWIHIAIRCALLCRRIVLLSLLLILLLHFTDDD